MASMWSKYCIILTTLAASTVATIIAPRLSDQQKPLGTQRPIETTSAPYALREQSQDLCNAGSRYWTGTVNITDEKSIFFWYFESRRDPQNDPLVLWMSGGPGATGALGLFKGIGPCVVNPDGNSTTQLQYGWTDHANVLIVDQPSGVGFSHITNREHIAVNLLEGGRDIHAFLRTFTKSVFPDLAGRPLHIAGESMGGHYVTGYTHHIARLEQEILYLEDPEIAFEPLNIVSSIVVDGYVDFSRHSVGYYDFFCTDWRRDGREAPMLNDTACGEMGAAVSHCESLGEKCRETYDKDICFLAATVCTETVGGPYLADVKPGGWDPYDSRHKCQEPPLCSDFNTDATLEFLNRPWVQERLVGVSNISFELIDFDVNTRWDEARYTYIPVTRELSWLLDNTNIRILYLNGNNDIIINTPGQIRLLDEQPWKGQAEYRAKRFHDWYFKNGEIVKDSRDLDAKKGGTVKGDRRLSFFTVDEAGHFAPFHQPEAIGAVLRAWLGP